MKREIVKVCLACGKLEGMQWWDVSCEINSARCYKDKLVFNKCGKVVKVWDEGLVDVWGLR